MLIFLYNYSDFLYNAFYFFLFVFLICSCKISIFVISYNFWFQFNNILQNIKVFIIGHSEWNQGGERVGGGRVWTGGVRCGEEGS